MRKAAARGRAYRPALLAALAVAAAVAAGGCGGESSETATVTVTTSATTTSSSSATTTATGAPAGDVFARIPEIVRAVEPSIVSIAVATQGGSGEGSGVIWSSDGLIVTNAHVVQNAENVEVVLASGERLPGRVRASDPRTDLAVVEIDRDDLPAADWAEELPEQGELVLALGNPLGFENTVTEGIVSGLHRAIPSGGQTPALVDLIQTSAAISPGNSGGALVDADGRVVGVNVAYIPPEAGAVSLGFAIPAATAVDVVEELLANGRVEHAYLGITPSQNTPELGEQFGLETDEGVLVMRVEEGTAAADAGVEEGDVIVALDGEEIETVEDLFGELRQHKPGDVVEVEVLRDGERVELQVTLADRPE
jgi:S1-C subfamily serine protease